MPPSPAELWQFLPLGYLLTIWIETPILLVGLAPRHSLRQRLLAGVLLTACTYPIVVLVLPLLLWDRCGETVYLVVAETFAPLAESLLFLVWTWPTEPLARSPGTPSTGFPPGAARDVAVIILANLASFLLGELVYRQS